MMQNLEVLPAQLGVKHQGNRLALSYPATARNYVLEVANSFGPAATWTRVSETPAIAGDAVVVNIPQPSGDRFYRLVRVVQPDGQPPGGESPRGTSLNTNLRD